MSHTHFDYPDRAGQLQALGAEDFDVAIIGGGISGIAAGHVLTERGYRVALIDNHDFASGTSQESSQLIWGGIKYLAQGHVRLSANLCRDRNALVRRFPDRAQPLRFVYPRFDHDPNRLFTIMLGGYVYWVLGRAYDRLPQQLSSRAIVGLIPKLRVEGFRGGMEYSEASMIDSDARLALDLLFDAAASGLRAANYAEYTDLRWDGSAQRHVIEVEDKVGGAKLAIKARWIVNTAGCWVDGVNDDLGLDPPHRLIFSKGIHIVLPRIESAGRALTCLAGDGRIFFVIPWGDRTLVGTTDTPHDAPPARVNADESDIDYLRSECEAKFNIKFDGDQVLNTKAGLRPLVRPAQMTGQDFLSLARSHKVWSDPGARVTALWGGKYTDAFSTANQVADTVGIEPSGARGEPIVAPRGLLIEDLESMGSAEALEESCRREWVVRLEDLLRRRTNLGLKVANGAWGANGEHAKQIEELSRAIARANATNAADVLEDYEKARPNPASD